MPHISAEAVWEHLPYPALINALDDAFRGENTTPLRQHIDIPNPTSAFDTTLLLMPSWSEGGHLGVKIVTVAPEATPSINGTYLLFDSTDGALLATMDAPALTAKRTAAASALASRYLSREDATAHLMVGTGTLAPELIQAHAAVRRISKTMIWGRNSEKAQAVADSISDMDIEVVPDLEAAVTQADIISVATMSREPLIKGDWLKSGQHLDMVGAFRPDMREADDECLKRSIIYVDNRECALKETGDLAIPLSKGIITERDVIADLFDLTRGSHKVNRSTHDITFFKSVGNALEDLAAAKMVAAAASAA